MIMKLSSMPDPKPRETLTLSDFSGGINRRDDPVKLAASDALALVNLWPDGGVLCRRPGLRLLAALGTEPENADDTARGSSTAAAGGAETAEAVGQTAGIAAAAETAGDGTGAENACFFPRLWNGYAVLAMGRRIWYFDPDADPCTPRAVRAADGSALLLPGAEVSTGANTEGAEAAASTACTGSTESTESTESTRKTGGSFFAFGEHLYYKAPGCYLRLRCTAVGAGAAEDSGTASDGNAAAAENQSPGDAITAEPLLIPDSTGGYTAGSGVLTPVIAVNRSADGSRSDAYQPENRINPRKTVRFDIDGSSLSYVLPVHGCRVVSVRLGDAYTEEFRSPQSGSDRVGQLAGRYVTLEHEDADETSADYTTLRFDIPLYADESGWGSHCWLTQESHGGNYLKNVVYSSFNLPGPSAADGVLVPQTRGEEAEAALARYGHYARIAMLRARRDYGEDVLSGRYLIAASGTYLTVYLEGAGGMRLTGWNPDTTEFRAIGWFTEGTRLPEDEALAALNTPVPALLSNQLEVTYEKPNPDAMAAIADCGITCTLGGSDAICVVMAGSSAQPNAVFWSGSGSAGVDPTYFPMDQYNLCGSYHDPVTGFGLQQSSLIILQRDSVGKGSYSVEELSGRKFIDIAYRSVNTRYGCDRPGTIALCGNNLVWAHSRWGVLLLRSTSPAGENQVVCVSEKAEPGRSFTGGSGASGSIAMDAEGPKQALCAAADRSRYYLFLTGGLWVWDFSRGRENPCWSTHTIAGIRCALTCEDGAPLLADTDRRLLRLDPRCSTDLGAEIYCRYVSPPLQLGDALRRKELVSLLLQLTPETHSARLSLLGVGSGDVCGEALCSLLQPEAGWTGSGGCEAGSSSGAASGNTSASSSASAACGFYDAAALGSAGLYALPEPCRIDLTDRLPGGSPLVLRHRMRIPDRLCIALSGSCLGLRSLQLVYTRHGYNR